MIWIIIYKTNIYIIYTGFTTARVNNKRFIPNEVQYF